MVESLNRRCMDGMDDTQRAPRCQCLTCTTSFPDFVCSFLFHCLSSTRAKMMPIFATDYAIVIESSHNAAIKNSMTERDDRSLAAPSMQTHR
jgi:hypothetical protein